jgi:capsular exopolysaccharide synthesis family protein
MGASSIDLELRRKEVDAAEAVLKRLTDERNRLDAELQSTKQRIAVLYAPEPPRRLNVAAEARVVGFAGFLGLLGGVFGVCWWEARKRRVLNKQEIVCGLGCRVMGELPWVRGGAARTRGAGADPSLLLNEAVHGLRAMLLCEAEEQTSGRVLMVTSAVAQEGKTTLASHLAASFAEAGRRTLLLDCDFRRPQLHHVFDLPAGPGLQEVLGGQVTAADAARPGPVDGLSVMTSGETTQRVSHAQMLDGLRTLLDELRQRYDFIVVDCCPVLPVADALFIGKRADGVLLSIRPRLSQLPQVYEAFERLSSMNIPVKGAVLNGVRDIASAYEYGYAHQHGS